MKFEPLYLSPARASHALPTASDEVLIAGWVVTMLSNPVLRSHCNFSFLGLILVQTVAGQFPLRHRLEWRKCTWQYSHPQQFLRKGKQGVAEGELGLSWHPIKPQITWWALKLESLFGVLWHLGEWPGFYGLWLAHHSTWAAPGGMHERGHDSTLQERVSPRENDDWGQSAAALPVFEE